MSWYDDTLNNLKKGITYSHKDLITDLRERHPNLSVSSFHWAVSGMLKHGALVKTGYDSYMLADESIKPEYRPQYSAFSRKIRTQIANKYPNISFMVLETFLLNPFLDQPFENNTVFVQTEKKSGVYVFRFLQSLGYHHVLIKPTRKEFYLYWAKDCIVVTDLISESPQLRDRPHEVCLEKLLVDIVADNNIGSTFNESEYPYILERAEKSFRLDKTRMLRYAKRRNKKEFIEEAIKNTLNI